MQAANPAEAALDYVEEFAAAAGWFADHVSHTSPRRPVPTCPGWSVLELVAHVGNIYSWAATVVETGRAASSMDDRPPSARSARVSDWYLGKAEDLYTVLRDTPTHRACWNFAFGTGTVAFWKRRQLHETLIHGVDLAIAGDLDEHLPAELAADGVDEALTVFLRRMHSRGHPAELTQPISLVATDAGLAWLVEPAPRATIPAQPVLGSLRGRSVPQVIRTSRPAEDTVEAPAGVLMKLLWKRARPTDPDVKLTGDEDRIERFLASRLTP
jgi:uncharacterized protein (TIGR03083 family)